MRRVTISYYLRTIPERRLTISHSTLGNEIVVDRPSNEALSLLNALMVAVSNSDVFASIGGRGTVDYVSVTYDADDIHIMERFNNEYESLLDDMEFGWLF